MRISGIAARAFAWVGLLLLAAALWGCGGGSEGGLVDARDPSARRLVFVT